MADAITATDVLINPPNQSVILCHNTFVCCGFGGHRSVEVFYSSVTIFDPDVVGGSGCFHQNTLVQRSCWMAVMRPSFNIPSQT